MAFGRDLYRSRRPTGFDTRSAIESTRNIASLSLSAPVTDDDVAAVVHVLEVGALPIADVAKALAWDSGRVADALERGGKAGLLNFKKTGDTTTVSLGKL